MPLVFQVASLSQKLAYFLQFTHLQKRNVRLIIILTIKNSFKSQNYKKIGLDLSLKFLFLMNFLLPKIIKLCFLRVQTFERCF